MDGIAGTVRHDSEMPFPKPTALVPDGRVKRSTRHRGVAYVGMSRARKLQPNHLTLPSHCRLGIRSHVAGSLISTTSSNSIVTTAIAVRIRFERFQRASKRRRQEHYEGKELHNASAYQAERRWTSPSTRPFRHPIHTLQRTVTFYRTYKRPPRIQGLSWAHYRVLMLDIDLGFEVIRRQSIHLALIDAPSQHIHLHAHLHPGPVQLFLKRQLHEHSLGKTKNLRPSRRAFGADQLTPLLDIAQMRATDA